MTRLAHEPGTREVGQMLKWLAPAALAVTLLGTAVAPAQAQRYDRYDRGRISARQDDFRDRLVDRAREIENRAQRLFHNGRLSRSHLDRTLAKLTRVHRDVRGNDRIDRQRFDADMRWLDDVENTMQEWARAEDGRRNVRRR